MAARAPAQPLQIGLMAPSNGLKRIVEQSAPNIERTSEIACFTAGDGGASLLGSTSVVSLQGSKEVRCHSLPCPFPLASQPSTLKKVAVARCLQPHVSHYSADYRLSSYRPCPTIRFATSTHRIHI